MQTLHLEQNSTILSLASGKLSGLTRPEQEAKFNHLGGSDPKIFLELFDKSGSSKPLEYIARLDRGYTKNWLIHKAIGLPVIDKVYYSEDPKLGTLVYTPDLTSEGGALYGKARRATVFNLIGKEDFVSSNGLDETFVALISLDFISHAILKQLYHYAELASAYDYYLAYDDPFELYLYPDKTWDIICLDLDKASFYPSESEKEMMSKYQREHFDLGARVANMMICSHFWQVLHKLKDGLREKSR